MFYPDDLERLGALSTLVGGRMLPWVRHHWRQCDGSSLSSLALVGEDEGRDAVETGRDRPHDVRAHHVVGHQPR
jgi:hypothetical protein